MATFIVSGSPDRIEQVGDDEDSNLSQYQSAEDAGDGIKQDWHGEYGTRYVLEVTVKVVAVYERPWTLVKGTPE